MPNHDAARADTQIIAFSWKDLVLEEASIMRALPGYGRRTTGPAAGPRHDAAKLKHHLFITLRDILT